jgi:multicomponent Na+:H+ antiporter subunit A
VVERVGPARIYQRGLAQLNAVSDRLHEFEVRDLRTRVAAVLAPAGLLAAAGLIAVPSADYSVGSVGTGDIELLLALIVVSAGALALAPLRTHITMVLLLSGLGYALALVYAFFGAPDVALVAVLVETVLALVVFGVLSLVPPDVMRREAERPERGPRWREPLVACVAAVFAFLVTWGALSRPESRSAVGEDLYGRAPEAHADDSVTAILADFRGLDTLGEITVVVVAMIGVARAVYPRVRDA